MPRRYYRDHYRNLDVEYEHHLADLAEEKRIEEEEAAHRELLKRWNRGDLCPICSRVDRCRCEEDPGDRDLIPVPPYRDPGWAA